MSTTEHPAGLEQDLDELRDLLRRTTVRSQRGVRSSVLLAVLIWAAAAGWLWFTVSRVSSMERRRTQLVGEVTRLAATRDSLVRQRNTLLAAQGFSSERLRQGVKASDVAMAAAASTARMNAAVRGNPEVRGSISVQVFSRDVDRAVVAASLRELGYRMVERGPTAAIPSGTATNAIWYGAGVPLEDVKLVAYTLLRAGIGLYYIEPIRSAGRERVIQVGSVSGPPRRPAPFTVDQIRAAASFPSVLRPQPSTASKGELAAPTPSYGDKVGYSDKDAAPPPEPTYKR